MSSDRICAVCHEPIDDNKPYIVLNYRVGTFYFCSDLHQEEFEAQTEEDNLDGTIQ